MLLSSRNFPRAINHAKNMIKLAQLAGDTLSNTESHQIVSPPLKAAFKYFPEPRHIRVRDVGAPLQPARLADGKHAGSVRVQGFAVCAEPLLHGRGHSQCDGAFRLPLQVDIRRRLRRSDD